MAVVGWEKSRLIWVLARIAHKMFGNGIHKVLKFFNKPNVYLGMVEYQLKGLRKGGYTYGPMLAWQMVFVLFMSSQLCLCSFKKLVWVEPCREGEKTPSLGSCWVCWGRNDSRLHEIGRRDTEWRWWLEVHTKTQQGLEGYSQANLRKNEETFPGTKGEKNFPNDLGHRWIGWKQSCKDRGNTGYLYTKH